MKIKKQLYNQCLESIENRLSTVKNLIHEIEVSLTSKTKSSAGDKHETGRAMLQLEREKAGHQLAEIQYVKEALFKIETDTSSKIVCLGSVVYTTQANYYISISAGILNIGSESFYAISPSTPIGKLLLSKTEGDNIVFRTQQFKIKKII